MGLLVTFEGIDGSGKGTQSLLTHERLQSEGFDSQHIAFPVYESETGEEISRYLRGEMGDISVEDASKLFSLDRAAQLPRLREQLAKKAGIFVIDRFTDSNIAHQGGKLKTDAKRLKFANYMQQVERELGLPTPDITFRLDITPEFAQKQVDLKAARAYTQGKTRDIHESDVNHLANAAHTYDLIAEREPQRFVKIDVMDETKTDMRTREEINQDIMSALAPLLAQMTDAA